jgi:hypothetical protein
MRAAILLQWGVVCKAGGEADLTWWLGWRINDSTGESGEGD